MRAMTRQRALTSYSGQLKTYQSISQMTTVTTKLAISNPKRNTSCWNGSIEIQWMVASWRCAMACMNCWNAWYGDFHPSVWRGRLFIMSAMESSASWSCTLRSVPVRVKAVVAWFMRAEALYPVLMSAFRWVPSPSPDWAWPPQCDPSFGCVWPTWPDGIGGPVGTAHRGASISPRPAHCGAALASRI